MIWGHRGFITPKFWLEEIHLDPSWVWGCGNGVDGQGSSLITVLEDGQASDPS